MANSETTSEQDREADALFESFQNQPPQIDQHEMTSMEEAAHSMGINRRAAIASLTRSGAQLIQWAEKSEADAVLLAMLEKHTTDYLKHIEAQRSLLDTARTRMQVALCSRADMKAIYEKAGEQIEADQSRY